jgi:HEAT repeats
VSPEKLLVAGALLVAVAFAWRWVARARTVAVLRRAARDPRRWVRRAAIEVMAEQGLHRFGKLLAERIEVEDVPAVREALAIAIVRNQWEPADSMLMMRLRLWAHLELESRREEAEAAPGIGSAEARGALGGRTDWDARPDGATPRPALRPLRPVPRIAIQRSDSAPPAQPDGELPASLRRLRRASGQR